MSKKYLRPGGMCQFFDEHFPDGDVDLNKLSDKIFKGNRESKEDEPYYARIERIMFKRARRNEQN